MSFLVGAMTILPKENILDTLIKKLVIKGIDNSYIMWWNFKIEKATYKSLQYVIPGWWNDNPTKGKKYRYSC